MECLMHTEKVFRVSKCAEGDKLEFATNQLTGNALHWWQVAVKRLQDEFMHLEHGSRSMQEYTLKRQAEEQQWTPQKKSQESGTNSKGKGLKEQGKWCKKCRRRHSGSCPTDAPLSGSYKCGNQGDIARDCWAERKCYQCGATDHIRPNCPQLKCGTPHDKPREEHRGKKEDTKGRGGPVTSRAFQMAVEEAREKNDKVSAAMADGRYVWVSEHIQGCGLKIYETIFSIYSKSMTTKEFGVIVGIEWLATNHANMDCENNNIVVIAPDGTRIKIHGERQHLRMPVISFAKARSSVSKGGASYLAYVAFAKPSKVVVDDIAVVKEFLDVFPEELLGLPPDCQIEYVIDLVQEQLPLLVLLID
ncbi:hypothetical protein L2E82_45150 [Cichorium intybus]|uniref:Uncharacterized protein n=1 Tax=Cichorium intybus TaxID=13427 RepID=A0ACB8ZS33_CICIN|nr:hypothetical protein L2E82_45150 [Cichorium intybus]